MSLVSEDIRSLLAELAGLGIQLRLDGEALRFTAPAGALTPHLRTRLQASKPDIIAALRASSTTKLRASLTQRRFWTLQRLDPEWPFYNVPFLFQLRGVLEAATLHRALDAVAARHESLRTTLHEQDGELMQMVAQEGGVDWLEADFRAAPPDQAPAMLRREMLRTYDFTKDRMLRAVLLQVAHDTWLFQLCLHNVVFDMASILVILSELSEHYSSFAVGHEARLPPPVQYADYTRWQAGHIASTGMERSKTYWANWFARGEQPNWSWPQRTTLATPGFESIPTWTRFTAQENTALQAVARARGVTIYILMLTAYLLTLRQFTGCPDITIGTTYSDRDDQRFASMIGASIVVPALRVDMTDDPSLANLLLRVREVLAGALTHQDLPLDEVLPDRPKGPLFRVVCTAFPDTPHGKLRLAGIRTEWQEEWLNPISRPQLYLVIWETPSPHGPTLTCHMMHRQDVWDSDMAEAMINNFTKNVQSIMGTH